MISTPQLTGLTHAPNERLDDATANPRATPSQSKTSSTDAPHTAKADTLENGDSLRQDNRRLWRAHDNAIFAGVLGLYATGFGAFGAGLQASQPAVTELGRTAPFFEIAASSGCATLLAGAAALFFGWRLEKLGETTRTV